MKRKSGSKISERKINKEKYAKKDYANFPFFFLQRKIYLEEPRFGAALYLYSRVSNFDCAALLHPKIICMFLLNCAISTVDWRNIARW